MPLRLCVKNKWHSQNPHTGYALEPVYGTITGLRGQSRTGLQDNNGEW